MGLMQKIAVGLGILAAGAAAVAAVALTGGVAAPVIAGAIGALHVAAPAALPTITSFVQGTFQNIAQDQASKAIQSIAKGEESKGVAMKMTVLESSFTHDPAEMQKFIEKLQSNFHVTEEMKKRSDPTYKPQSLQIEKVFDVSKKSTETTTYTPPEMETPKKKGLGH